VCSFQVGRVVSCCRRTTEAERTDRLTCRATRFCEDRALASYVAHLSPGLCTSHRLALALLSAVALNDS
jgi:hypothetical protein